MTTREAIVFFKRSKCCVPGAEYEDAAYDKAIEALERNVPAENQFFAPDFLCPKCGLGFAQLPFNVKYCPECGQKIKQRRKKK